MKNLKTENLYFQLFSFINTKKQGFSNQCSSPALCQWAGTNFANSWRVEGWYDLGAMVNGYIQRYYQMDIDDIVSSIISISYRFKKTDIDPSLHVTLAAGVSSWPTGCIDRYNRTRSITDWITWLAVDVDCDGRPIGVFHSATILSENIHSMGYQRPGRTAILRSPKVVSRDMSDTSLYTRTSARSRYRVWGDYVQGVTLKVWKPG